MNDELNSLLKQLENNRIALEATRKTVTRDTKVTTWLIVVLFFCLAFVLASTDECKADTLYLGQKSHHFNPVGRGIVRESHALAIYEHSSGWMVGYWRNSYNNDSYAVGYHHYLWKTSNKGEPDMSFGLKGGVVTGYNTPVFGAINVQIGYFDVNIVPSEVVSVGLKFDW